MILYTFELQTDKGIPLAGRICNTGEESTISKNDLLTYCVRL